MPDYSIGARLLMPSALLFSSLFSGQQAFAQCAPDPTVTGGNVTCTGTDLDGFVTAFDDVTVDITGTVSPAMPMVHGLRLTGSNAVVQMTGTGSIIGSPGGSGILLEGSNAQVTMGSLSSIFSNGDSGGITFESTGAQVVVGGTISGSGHFGHGILDFNNGGNQVTVSSTGVVTTTGDDARAIDLQASNASIIVAGTVSTSGGQTTGDAAHALIVGDENLSTTGGLINLQSTARVNVSASGAGGILASGSGTQVTIASGAIVTSSGEAGPLNSIPSFGVGSNADNGVVDNAGSIIATPSTGSVGAILGGANSIFNNQATGVLVGGGFVPPLEIAFAFLGDAGEVVTLNNQGAINGSVLGFGDADMIVNNVSGAINGHVILGVGDDQVDAQSLIDGDVALDEGSDVLLMTASTVTGAMDGGDDVASADGWVDRLHIQGGSRAITAGELENWEVVQLSAATSLTMDLPSLAVGGDAGLDAGSGLPYGLVLQEASSVALAQSLALSGNVSNGSELSLSADGSVGTQLTVSGDFVGAGGVVRLDAALSDDTSPSDILRITGTGTITGASILEIQNLGGPGAATLGDGILVVETTAGAVSTPDAFTLSGPIVVGGFEYELFFGGVADPGDGNWYLRSAVATGGAGATGIPAMPASALLALIFGLLLLGGFAVSRLAPGE